jgi:hypothetical protein
MVAKILNEKYGIYSGIEILQRIKKNKSTVSEGDLGHCDKFFHLI